MKKLNKSQLTVVILFVLMLISIALLVVFMLIAASNLEDKQGAASEIEPVIEEQVSFNDYLPTETKDELRSLIS
jgi:Na+/serine symporter